jgi:putative DNA primase/helicase
LKAEETLAFQEVLNLIQWESRRYAKLFGGWMVVASVGGALDWRPHVWITGGAGTGKSYLMQNVIHRLLKKMCHYFRGQTTEAGIRQIIRSDSKALIFDEFETDDERSAVRVAANLELIRQASSESDGQVAKGSPSGQAIIYRPRFAALVSSIRVPLIHEADKTRFTVLELLHREGSEENFRRLKKGLTSLPKDFPDRLFSRTFELLPVLRQSIDTLWEAFRTSASARTSQQYSALLAGWWILGHDSPISETEAMEVVKEFDPKEVESDREESECLDFLMKKVERVSGQGNLIERSIGEMVVSTWGYHASDDSSDGAYIKILDRLGLRVTAKSLYVSQVHPSLSRLFGRTRWMTGWSKSLSRIPGAENNIMVRIGSKPSRCVRIPINQVLGPKTEGEDGDPDKDV